MTVLLAVPYEQKDEAKALGAKWNPTLKKWYVPDGDAGPLERFERWLPQHKPKERVDSSDHGRTGPARLIPLCSCDVLPWEDCEHTK